LLDQPRRPAAQLFVGRLYVDHHVSVDLAQPIISVELNALSTSFWAVPAFIRVEPEIGSGRCRPRCHVDELGQGGLCHAGQANRGRATLACAFERADHPRRLAAGGDAEGNVYSRQVVGGIGAGRAIVLSALTRLQERTLAASQAAM